MMTGRNRPYNERTDTEKIQSQWVKLTGLHSRTDWSAAVVRAATATEITANLAIRSEYAIKGDFDTVTIDKKLKDANGLKGKMRLLLELLKGTEKCETVRSLRQLAEEINEKRNEIVHRGDFCGEQQATELIAHCRTFVHGIVRLYEPDFTLEEKSTLDDDRTGSL